MLFDDGMTASEVRETLGITHQTVLMLIEDGQIQRTLISHARGGKYSYDTQSVFAYLYHRKYGIDVFADDETILKQLQNNKKKKKNETQS
jgi:predicted transcriptional regulator